MSIRGKTIRGAGGLLKRNTKPGVGMGAPHGGEEGQIRVQMVQGSPRLYARAGGEWYGTNLFSGGVADKFRIGSSDEYLQVESGNIEMTGKIVLRSGGTQNVCIGVDNNDVGTSNISIGVKAGRDLASTALRNVLIGSSAGLLMTSGGQNVCIGTNSGDAMVSGDYSCFVGVGSGGSTTGDKNTFIGAFAGQTTTSGEENVCIGYGAYASAVGTNNEIVIGKSASGQGANYAVIGNSNITRVYMAEDSGATVHCTSLTLKETTTPTALADHGKIYTKNDNKLYFQDGAGTEHEVTIS